MKVSFFCALISCSFAAFAQTASPPVRAQNTTPVLEAYVVQQDLVAQQIAPIKSQVDLGNYLALRLDENSPLAALSPEARAQFISSLVFGANGLASFDYSSLRSELTPTQAYQVMALFGMQRTTALMKGLEIKSATDKMVMRNVHPTPMACGSYPTPGQGTGCDHEGYRCESRATCMQAMSAICTPNC